VEILPIATWSAATSIDPSFSRALAVSLVFHLALFWPAFPDERAAVAAAPLLAVLRPGGQSTVHDESPAVSRSPALQRSGGRDRVVARKLDRFDGADPATTRSSADSSRIESAAGDRPESSAITNHVRTVPSAMPATPGLDAEGLRGFRVELAREARRHKHYPAQAMEYGWQGTVEVEVTIRVGGVAKDARLARTSGHPLLDSAAVEMMTRALTTTTVPAVLRERDFLLTLPVVFERPQ
jgi:protein TonB